MLAHKEKVRWRKLGLEGRCPGEKGKGIGSPAGHGLTLSCTHARFTLLTGSAMPVAEL